MRRLKRTLPIAFALSALATGPAMAGDAFEGDGQQMWGADSIFSTGNPSIPLGMGYNDVDLFASTATCSFSEVDANGNVTYTEKVRLQVRRPDISMAPFVFATDLTVTVPDIPESVTTTGNQFQSTCLNGQRTPDFATPPLLSGGIAKLSDTENIFLVGYHADPFYMVFSPQFRTFRRDRFVVGAYRRNGTPMWRMTFAGTDTAGRNINRRLSRFGSFIKAPGNQQLRVVTDRVRPASTSLPKGGTEYVYRYYNLLDRSLLSQKAFIVPNP